MAVPSVRLGVALLAALGVAAHAGTARARSFWYSGELNADVRVHLEQAFELEGVAGPFTVKAARYESSEGPVNRQRIEGFRTECTPPPDRVAAETDRHGNRFESREWRKAPSRIVCLVDFTARLETNLEPLGALGESPLNTARERRGVPYLQDARMLDQDDGDIRALARRLGQGARGQIDALVAVLRYVVDHVDYVVNPPSYSASEALEKGRGNCQNYAHLAVALLHDLGLEARVVNGLSLKHAWRVPLTDGTLTFDNAQGRHAWLEVRLADLGWVSFDPQSSHFFVSTNLVRQAVALESAEVADRFTSLGRRIRFRETIETEYANETNTLALRADAPVPESFIIAGLVLPAVGGAEVAPPPPRPKPLLVVDPRLREQPPPPPPPVVAPPPAPPVPTVPPVAPPVVERPAPAPSPPPTPRPPAPPVPSAPPPPPVFDEFAEIGLIDLSEQAYEYVTSQEVYAQRFEIRRPLRLWEAELALQKFGGEKDGALWVEILDDVGGLPAERVRFESTRMPLGEVPLGKDFAWVPFSFRALGESATLAPGRYWIALRYTPDAIVNWHCRIGNPYLDPDDTRSRPLAGGRWNNLLHVDFNFLLTGLE